MTVTTEPQDGVRPLPALDWAACLEDLEVGQAFATPPRGAATLDVAGADLLALALTLLPTDPDRVVGVRRIATCDFARPLRRGRRASIEGEVTAVSAGHGPTGTVELRFAVCDEAGHCAHGALELAWHTRQHDDPFAPGPDGFVPLPL